MTLQRLLCFVRFGHSWGPAKSCGCSIRRCTRCGKEEDEREGVLSVLARTPRLP